MPRQSRGRSSAPAPRSAPAPAPAQTRGAHTAATAPGYAPARAPAPPAGAAAPAATAQPQQPGMLAQMAATAGSVAVGSTIGHGLSHMLFGGSSSTPVESQAQAPPTQQAMSSGQCEIQAKDFTKCMEVADFQSCSYYLEQLKACQAAASQFSS